MSARESLREWLRKEIAKRKEIKAPDLTTAAVQEFGNDKEWLREFMGQQLRTMVYQEVQTVIAETRKARPIDSVNFEAMKRDQDKNRDRRWLSRLEHTGEGHIRIGDMDKTKGLKAASVRFRIGHTNIKMGVLLQRLAGGLQSKQTIADRYTDDEIEKMWNKILNEGTNEEVA